MMQPWWRYYEEDGTRDDAKVSDLLSQESTDGSSAALDGELSGTPVATVSTFKRRSRGNQSRSSAARARQRRDDLQRGRHGRLGDRGKQRAGDCLAICPPPTRTHDSARFSARMLPGG